MTFWAIMEHTGWSILEHTGRYRSILEDTGLYWTNLEARPAYVRTPHFMESPD